MSVFRDISIRFKGVDHTVTPSNRLLRMIEGRARVDDPSFNLARVFYEIQVGPVSIPSLAYLGAEFLKASGAQITDDDVLGELGAMTQKDLIAFKDAVASCVMPEVKGKKPDAPAKPAQPRAKKKSQR
ncbi:MAG: hypothetical protein ACPG61_07055 [Paracoccaceae bacterium]